MEGDGLLTLGGGTLSMTQRGRPLVRLAAAAFHAWMPTSAARHFATV